MAALSGVDKRYREPADEGGAKSHRVERGAISSPGGVVALRGQFQEGRPLPIELFQPIDSKARVNTVTRSEAIRTYLAVAEVALREAAERNPKAVDQAKQLFAWASKNVHKIKTDSDLFAILRVAALARKCLTEKKERLFDSKDRDTIPVYLTRWIPKLDIKQTTQTYLALTDWKNHVERHLHTPCFAELHVVLEHWDYERIAISRNEDWIATAIKDGQNILQGVSFSIQEGGDLDLSALATGYWNLSGKDESKFSQVTGAGTANIEELMDRSLKLNRAFVVGHPLSKAREFYKKIGFRQFGQEERKMIIDRDKMFQFLATHKQAGRAFYQVPEDLAD